MLQNIQHNPQHIRAVLAGPLFIYEFSGPQLLLFLLVLSQYFFIWPGATPRAHCGSFAIFAAIRRASSLVSNLAADRRPAYPLVYAT
jgi:hypothetical protein